MLFRLFNKVIARIVRKYRGLRRYYASHGFIQTVRRCLVRTRIEWICRRLVAFFGNTIDTKFLMKSLQGCCLILDHSYGGGANYYRENRVKEEMKRNNSVVLLTYLVVFDVHMHFRLIVYRDAQERVFDIYSYRQLEKFLKQARIEKIIYNTLTFCKDFYNLLPMLTA
ncbi:MAG: hypothetical protein GY821_17890 [Gammaproteobacteria bacterium]|nr:hypothetical protein [Gammaproteobacteria bacterium]